MTVYSILADAIRKGRFRDMEVRFLLSTWSVWYPTKIMQADKELVTIATDTGIIVIPMARLDAVEVREKKGVAGANPS